MEFIRMFNKKIISFSAVFMALLSLNTLSAEVDNPFRKALEITNKHMPNALGTMWQSEHLIWRAQLFNAACNQNTQPIQYAINAGFLLVNQYIIDQAITSNALIDENTRLILQDSNKLYYKVFTKIYSYAYTRRLQIIQQYQPEITNDLCAHAETASQQYPADEVPMLPWQITNQVEFMPWRADLFSMRTVNNYFVAAFINQQKRFAHVIDAKIYAQMHRDEKLASTFSELTDSYQYQALLMNEITQVYNQANDNALSDKLWRASYAQEAIVLASQAYKLATVSALMQIKALYPERYQQIESHMSSYIKLQMARLGEDKVQLNKAFNAR